MNFHSELELKRECLLDFTHFLNLNIYDIEILELIKFW